MSESHEDLPGPTLTECPTCGEEYRSLSQHWAMSACEYPSIDEELHQVIRGCLLGDGTVDGTSNPLVEISSMGRRVAEWYHEQLGWLSRGVTVDGRGSFRVRTLAHPGLDEYWTWAEAPRTGWELTPIAARVWHVSDASLDFGPNPRPYVTFSAVEDERRTAKRTLLQSAGFDVKEWDRRLAIAKDDVERWLDWIGDPVCGVRHKWATDRSVYQSHRSTSK